MVTYIKISILLTFLSPVICQIYPGSYEVSSNVISESGSSETGLCSCVTDSGRVCNSPRSSALFDNDSTLTELDGDMWARQLLTFNTSTSSASITFSFANASDTNGPLNYQGVSTIEVVMYNCPIRGIGTGTSNIIVSGGGSTIGSIVVTESSVSCDYLVRVCEDSLFTSSPIITLNFSMNYQRIYVAEIKFYSSYSRRCSAVGPILTSVIATTIPEMPTDTTNLQFSSNSDEVTTSMEEISSDPMLMESLTVSCNYSSIIAVASVLSFVLGNVSGILGILCLYGIYKIHKGKVSKKDKSSVELEAVHPSSPEVAVVYEDISEISKDNVPDILQLQENAAYGQLSP